MHHLGCPRVPRACGGLWFRTRERVEKKVGGEREVERVMEPPKEQKKIEES